MNRVTFTCKNAALSFFSGVRGEGYAAYRLGRVVFYWRQA